MYSIITNISATASHFNNVLIGVLLISLRVRTIMFRIFAMVPNTQTFEKFKNISMEK